MPGKASRNCLLDGQHRHIALLHIYEENTYGFSLVASDTCAISGVFSTEDIRELIRFLLTQIDEAA